MRVKVNINLDFVVDEESSYESMTKDQLEARVSREVMTFVNNDFREMMHDFHGVDIDSMKGSVDIEAM